MLLAVATPIAMMQPISEGTFNVVPVRKSIQRIPANAPGMAVKMMNGSSQDWKLTTMSRYTSKMANSMPNPRRIKEDCMVSTCPRIFSVVPAGSLLKVFRTLPMSFATPPKSRRSVLAYTSNKACTL